MTGEPPAGRVLAVGLDACSWPLVERLIAAGRLPTLAALAATASSSAVVTPASYRAELSWTAFARGRPPGESGYWGTVAYDPASYATWEAGALAAAPFYAGLGVPVVAVDVPHTVPWPGVPGAQVVAWGAHSPQHAPAAEPPGLAAKAIAMVGPHPAFDADSQPGWHSGRYQAQLVAALVAGAERRVDLVAALLDAVPQWRLALTVFSELHSAGHHLWHGVDASHPLSVTPGAAAAARRLTAVYEAVDRALGRLLQAVGPEVTVVVFAVHDTVANANDLPALYLVPELLHRDAFGWSALRPLAASATARGPYLPPPRCSLGALIEGRYRTHRSDLPRPPDAADAARDLGRDMVGRARRALRRRPVAEPPWSQLDAATAAAREAMWSAAPAATGAPLAARPFDYLGTARYQRFWPHQAVFALPTFSDTHLRVNVRGREGRGIVEPDQFGATLSSWERRLATLRDGRTGRSVVAETRRTRGVDPAGDGPPADLVVRFARPTDLLEDLDLATIGPLPYLRTGEHGDAGFVLVRRPHGPPPRLADRLEPTDLAGLISDLLHA